MKKIYKKLSSSEQKRIFAALTNYNFDLEKINLKRNIIGCVNRIYLVLSKKQKYILRQSHPSTKLNHLLLEVELLNYLKKKKFNLVPTIIKNKKGQHITRFQNTFYSLQTFLPGRIKAGWDSPDQLNTTKLINFFIASAQFTKAVQNFKSQTKIKNESLYYYVKNASNYFDALLKKLPSSPGKKLMLQNKSFISKFIAKNLTELAEVNYDKLPKQLIHFDIHPGNVHYLKDEISGLFDYDWIRFDSRISDIAATICQSCYYYTGKNKAKYRPQLIKKCLQAYRKAYGKSEFSPQEENHLAKIALKGYIIFQLIFFCLEKYLELNQSPDALEPLDHFLRLIKLNDFDKTFS